MSISEKVVLHRRLSVEFCANAEISLQREKRRHSSHGNAESGMVSGASVVNPRNALYRTHRRTASEPIGYGSEVPGWDKKRTHEGDENRIHEWDEDESDEENEDVFPDEHSVTSISNCESSPETDGEGSGHAVDAGGFLTGVLPVEGFPAGGFPTSNGNEAGHYHHTISEEVQRSKENQLYFRTNLKGVRERGATLSKCKGLLLLLKGVGMLSENIPSAKDLICLMNKGFTLNKHERIVLYIEVLTDLDTEGASFDYLFNLENTQQTKVYLFKMELCRLASLKVWAANGGRAANRGLDCASLEQLAEAGFFFTGRTDLVIECFVCMKTLNTGIAEPRTLLGVHYQTCEFVKGEPTGNIPLVDVEGGETGTADQQEVVVPDVCRFCGNQWESCRDGLDPVVMHSLSLPDCSHLDDVAVAGVSQPPDLSTLMKAFPPLRGGGRPPTQVVDKEVLMASLKSIREVDPAVQTVVKVFGVGLVERAVRKHYEHTGNRSFKEADHLVDAVVLLQKYGNSSL